MNIVLWIIAVVLAVGFAAVGAMKVVTPRATLIERMGWVEDFSDGAIKAIGVVEVAGALGLILPAVTGIAVILTPLAAAGLAVTMIGAILAHARRHEYGDLPLTVVLFALAVFVAWGRFGPYAF